MPWLPELFSAPALAHIWEDERRRRLALVPFFAGLTTGETNALIESFAGEPQLHHPIRGRVKGVAAFERFVVETRAWLADNDATAEDVEFVLTPGRGVEELILHLDGKEGRIDLPVAIASDHDEQGRILEQRVYFSTWPLTGRHANRPPLLQPDPSLHVPDIVAEAAVAELEHCAVTDDGHACALEYNVVASGQAAMLPQAGIAVYVRGDGGKLAAARTYGDTALSSRRAGSRR
jgi:hypothetical protein